MTTYRFGVNGMFEHRPLRKELLFVYNIIYALRKEYYPFFLENRDFFRAKMTNPLEQGLKQG